MPAPLTSPLPTSSRLLPLESQLENFQLATNPRGCVVTIRNNTTPEREALIVAAGVWFSYYEPEPAKPLLTPPKKKGSKIPKLPSGSNLPSMPETNDYMAGPVHIEVQPGTMVPFRFSDPRRPVYSVAIGVRVLFGNQFGFPPASFENYFWETPLPPLPSNTPAPKYPRLGELHLDFRMRRDVAQDEVPPASGSPVVPSPGTVPWPPIPVGLRTNRAHWFELAERPR